MGIEEFVRIIVLPYCTDYPTVLKIKAAYRERTSLQGRRVLEEKSF